MCVLSLTLRNFHLVTAQYPVLSASRLQYPNALYHATPSDAIPQEEAEAWEGGSDLFPPHPQVPTCGTSEAPACAVGLLPGGVPPSSSPSRSASFRERGRFIWVLSTRFNVWCEYFKIKCRINPLQELGYCFFRHHACLWHRSCEYTGSCRPSQDAARRFSGDGVLAITPCSVAHGDGV